MFFICASDTLYNIVTKRAQEKEAEGRFTLSLDPHAFVLLIIIIRSEILRLFFLRSFGAPTNRVNQTRPRKNIVGAK